MNALPYLLAALMFAPAVAGRGPSVAFMAPMPLSFVAPLPLSTGSVGAAVPQPASADLPAGRDPWLAEDKTRHLFMSFALTMLTFGAAEAAGADGRVAKPVAAGVTLATGIGKEIHDERSGRFFSLRDLAFDVLGIGLGLTLASYTR